jgi:hypothetical protein
MATVECPHEQDVLDAVAAGRWPARCDEELTSHVVQCRLCTDLVEVVGALTEAHDELWPSIQVPSAGTVWWRAQLRARREAAYKASRPITVIQLVASAAAVVVLVTLSYALAPWLTHVNIPRLEIGLPSWEMPSFAVSSAVPSFELPIMATLGMWGWLAIGAFVTWAVIAPLVIYLAVVED